MFCLAAKEGETARPLVSQCELRKIFFSRQSIEGEKKDISFWQTADCGLSTKRWPHAHIFTNHINGTTAHPRTCTLTQTFLTNQIKNGARTEEERFANWPDHPRRKGFKYHWKWGQCDCITSGSAELVKCLWWPSNSILQIICIMLQITLHKGSTAN